MINLTATPTGPGALPELSETAGLAVGRVYVFDAGSAQLPPDVKAVLRTDQGGRIEVLTSNTIASVPGARGTYLHAKDYAELVGQTQPTLRLYGDRDTLDKLKSAPGVLTALTAFLSLVTAVVGIFFVWSAMTSPTQTTITDRAQALLAWVHNPTNPGGPAHKAARAHACLAEIRGDTSSHVNVPQIPCAEVGTPWWRQAIWGSVITGVIGIASAVAGVITIASKFGFQKTPAA